MTTAESRALYMDLLCRWFSPSLWLLYTRAEHVVVLYKGGAWAAQSIIGKHLPD
jgi:hypothetical protein